MPHLIHLMVIILLTSSSAAMAQSQKRKNIGFNKQNKGADLFLKKQWYVGVIGGINLSKPDVEGTFSIVHPTSGDALSSRKKYKDFKDVGSQIGIVTTFYFSGLSISAQPSYQISRFSYSNSFEWMDAENSTSALKLTYNHQQQVHFLHLPIIVRYEKNIKALSPYLQAGFYTNLLLAANKRLQITGVDNASGGINAFEQEPINVGVKDLFARNYYGVLAGGGIHYTPGNVRFTLDIQYLHGLNAITSAENRYNNDRLSGVGDAMDDLSLRSVSISLGTLFPLRFLSSTFKSFDK